MNIKKFIFTLLIASYALSNLSFAQEVLTKADHLQQEIEKVQKDYRNKQTNLKRVGFEGHGFYPFCTDVISLYENQETQIRQVRADFSGVTRDIEPFRIDWLAIAENEMVNQTLSEDNIDMQDVPFGSWERTMNELHVALACFDGQTPVTILLKGKDVRMEDLTDRTMANATHFNGVFKRPTIYKYDFEGIPFLFYEVKMEDLKDYNIDGHEPYVLSSTLEIIPDPAFQVDCWSEFSIKQGTLEHGKEMANIAIKAPHGSIVHSTPMHRFYTCTRNDTESCAQYAWTRAKDLKLGMNFYSDQPVEIPFTAMSILPVKDESSWGIDRDRLVYNLSTMTYTFYVGPNQGRVLVHNIK